MRSIVLAALCGLVAVQPSWARSSHRSHGRSHGVRSHQAGIPITAQSDAIRINSVGEVISKPAAVIQKEKNFDTRAKRQLSAQPPASPAPTGTRDPLALRP